MSAQRGPLWSAEGEHQAGTYGGYTSRRRPVRLVWHQEFQQITDAIAVERQLKGWGRAKKEALIHGEWKMIRKLSTRRGGQEVKE
jgi:putative endonuclease